MKWLVWWVVTCCMGDPSPCYSDVCHAPAALASPGSCSKCRVSGPKSDLLNQNVHFHKIPKWYTRPLNGGNHFSQLFSLSAPCPILIWFCWSSLQNCEGGCLITPYVIFSERDTLFNRTKFCSIMDEWSWPLLKVKWIPKLFSQCLESFKTQTMFWKAPFSLLYVSPYEFNFVGNLSHMFLIHLHLTLEKVVLQQQLPVQKDLGLLVNPS